MDTYTAVLARLFARREGAGRFVATLPVGMRDLAEKIAVPADVGISITRQNGRWTFMVDSDTMAIIDDARAISRKALYKDARKLLMALNVVSRMADDINPLLPEEMAYLEETVGPGTWQQCVPILGEVR